MYRLTISPNYLTQSATDQFSPPPFVVFKNSNVMTTYNNLLVSVNLYTKLFLFSVLNTFWYSRLSSNQDSRDPHSPVTMSHQRHRHSTAYDCVCEAKYSHSVNILYRVSSSVAASTRIRLSHMLSAPSWRTQDIRTAVASDRIRRHLCTTCDAHPETQTCGVPDSEFEWRADGNNVFLTRCAHSQGNFTPLKGWKVARRTCRHTPRPPDVVALTFVRPDTRAFAFSCVCSRVGRPKQNKENN